MSNGTAIAQRPQARAYLAEPGAQLRLELRGRRRAVDNVDQVAGSAGVNTDLGGATGSVTNPVDDTVTNTLNDVGQATGTGDLGNDVTDTVNGLTDGVTDTVNGATDGVTGTVNGVTGGGSGGGLLGGG